MLVSIGHHRVAHPRLKSYMVLEYPFAKYNVQNQLYTYTQDEYTKFLSGEHIRVLGWRKLTYEDKDWTKEETDYLFDLVRQYDQRFYVVADRYEYPGGSSRSMEVRICIGLSRATSELLLGP